PRRSSDLSILSVGMRCAETTSTSVLMPNSASASAAADITGQSESEPITTPTRGFISFSPQHAGGVLGPLTGLCSIGPGDGHVAEFAARAHRLAVQVHFGLRVGAHHLRIGAGGVGKL